MRFLTLRESVFLDPDRFFRNYAELTDEEAVDTARNIWREINGRNLRENIAPTRDRASLILRKRKDHRVEAPVYSHVVYDIVDDERVVIEQPDIVILEGLNVLQTGESATEFVSDYFDFSIYIDAAESDIEQWYVERFLTLR